MKAEGFLSYYFGLVLGNLSCCMKYVGFGVFFKFSFKPGLTLSLAFGRSGILIVGSVYIMEYFINSLDWNCSLSPSLVIDVCKARVRSCFPFNICKHLVSRCYVMEEVSSGKRLEQHKPGEGE